jgi:purine-binding chemotaxis protein CheW
LAASRKHVCFVAREQEFAVPIAGVVETSPLRPLSRIFHAEPLLAGVMSLRGEIVAVLDLAVFLGLGSTDLAAGIVVVAVGEKRAGVLAERMSEVRDIDPATLRPVPQTIKDEQAPFFEGVVSLETGPVLLLNLAAIFADERLRRYDRRT